MIFSRAQRRRINLSMFNQTSTNSGYVNRIPGTRGLMIAVFRFIVLQAVNCSPGIMGLRIPFFHVNRTVIHAQFDTKLYENS